MTLESYSLVFTKKYLQILRNPGFDVPQHQISSMCVLLFCTRWQNLSWSRSTMRLAALMVSTCPPYFRNSSSLPLHILLCLIRDCCSRHGFYGSHVWDSDRQRFNYNCWHSAHCIPMLCPSSWAKVLAVAIWLRPWDWSKSAALEQRCVSIFKVFWITFWFHTIHRRSYVQK